MSKKFIEQVEDSAFKWGHVILKITGEIPTRRSFVMWFCTKHPFDGTHACEIGDSKLLELINNNILSQAEIDALISSFPGQRFFLSRMDNYLEPSGSGTKRTICCYAGMIVERKEEGFKIFKKLLAERGDHYNTEYKLLIDLKDYKGKRVKHTFKCLTHGNILSYSMQDLNTITSCPCPACRKDPKHKNACVEIVKKRNSGRAGQVIRHAKRVKMKYNNTCALSNSTFELQHHHLDGQDFYETIALNWNANGICLCGPIHRDYHKTFLKKHSIIAKEYSNYTFIIDNDEWIEVSSLKGLDYLNNPDYYPSGADISRYTFLEYLRFLIKDIKSNNSAYVDALNQKIKDVHSKLKPEDPSYGDLGQITLKLLETAIDKYCSEYKGANWVLASQTDIPFANDLELWAKVDNCWQ